MSSSLSTMPFSRQYGSFRVTSTTGGSGSNAAITASSPNAPNGVHHHHHRHHGPMLTARHSSGNDTPPGLQMAPLGYRVGNLARNVSNNWLNSGRNQNTAARTTLAALHHQQKNAAEDVPPCTVHRGQVKQALGEPIADTPLLQSPRIIARSTAATRIVEPNAWNRRLTTSNFCALPSTSNRLLCRKSPGSSGTSVESIVPKYSRSTAGATTTTSATTAATSSPHVEPTTAAQKRTYNAHKPQLRVTNGRIGTVAKKLTGAAAAATPSSSTNSSQNAEREVALVLHHHNLRVVDMLNNNHLQQQQQQQSSRAVTARSVKENNENCQPAMHGVQKQLPGMGVVAAAAAAATKKGSAIPQRLPLTDRDQPTATEQQRNKQRLLLGGGSTTAAGASAESSFSSKFPNGLPFEQEFYYRRAPADAEVTEMPEKTENEQHHHHHNKHHQRVRNGTKKTVLLPGRRGGGRTEHQVMSHRSRSASGEGSGTPSSTSPLQNRRRSVSVAVERLPDDEDALYVDFTKRREPPEQEQERSTPPAAGRLQTSVVEYRNINHSSYYYKFESVSQRKASLTGAGSSTTTAGRSRYQRSRLGLNRPPGATVRHGPEVATDVNGNAGRREYYDDDDEEGEAQEEDTDDDEEEEGESSTVYVAVATWVPKCNRLPKESGENNNSICLTLPAHSNGDAAEKVNQYQQQQQQQYRPTRIAVPPPTNNTSRVQQQPPPPPSVSSRTTQHPAAATVQTATTATPSSYGQL